MILWTVFDKYLIRTRFRRLANSLTQVFAILNKVTSKFEPRRTLNRPAGNMNLAKWSPKKFISIQNLRK